MLFFSFFLACSTESPPAAPLAPTAAAVAPAEVPPAPDAGHAAAHVQPGSHEDWCAEHALPESQCTLCNPSLVAAFKATNDWCPEHGLPESHCTKCNPDVKFERPPKSP